MEYKIKKLLLIFTLLLSLIPVSCGDNAKTSENEAGTVSDFTSREIAEAVLGSAEFPKMKELQDSGDLIKYIGIDYDYIEDVCFYWQAISVELAEVLIIIPKAGKEQAALDFADSRREKISNDTAFYPSQEAAAEASVSGIKNNVVYYICGREAGKAEDFLIEYLNDL